MTNRILELECRFLCVVKCTIPGKSKQNENQTYVAVVAALPIGRRHCSAPAYDSNGWNRPTPNTRALCSITSTVNASSDASSVAARSTHAVPVYPPKIRIIIAIQVHHRQQKWFKWSPTP